MLLPALLLAAALLALRPRRAVLLRRGARADRRPRPLDRGTRAVPRPGLLNRNAHAILSLAACRGQRGRGIRSERKRPPGASSGTDRDRLPGRLRLGLLHHVLLREHGHVAHQLPEPAAAAAVGGL